MCEQRWISLIKKDTRIKEEKKGEKKNKKKC